VLGLAHTASRRLVPVAIIALAILVLPAVGGADPSHSTASLRALDAQLVAKQRSAVLGLYSLDQQLAGARARLASFEAQTATLAVEQHRLARELTIARQGSRIAQSHLDNRLRALYEGGKVTPLEILLGAKSLDQALDDLNDLDSSAAQDEAIVHQVHAARQALETTTRGLAARRAALAASTRAADATAAALDATRAERTSYIGGLANQRQLNESQIARLVAQARAASLRSTQLQLATNRVATASIGIADTSPVLPLTNPTPTILPAIAPSNGRTLTVVATGYSLSGRTATGIPVGWGVAAVDPSVIPLGSHMIVPGYGEAVAADTGGAVGGAMIDLWFPTVAAANAWGRRTVTIVVY
jgi:3D (Asp-Asp-Asp) domain-containing protein/peptidoglycan hydrolase CwlO-like protein